MNCWFCYKPVTEGEYHPACSRKFFGKAVAPQLELNKELLQQLADQNINQRIAVTGVQPKLSVTLNKNDAANRLTVVGLWGEYILKPQHGQFEQMPETEDVTMHIASLFGIQVCDHTLLRATDGSLVYLARRFDRTKAGKVHVEDLCQLSEFLTEYKYKGSYEKAGKLVGRYCTHSGLDKLNYFELVLFSYLTGNNDMHLKNFSLIHLSDRITLSPAYDLLNVNLVNPKDDEELGLTLNGKKKKLKKEDFLALAAALEIPTPAVTNSFRRFTTQNKKVQHLINSSFLSDDYKARYWEIWMEKQGLVG